MRWVENSMPKGVYHRSAEFLEKNCSALPRRSGVDHPQWKNGSLDKRGYHLIRVGNKQVFAHRVVFSKTAGRALKPREVVHHWDEVKTNNAPKNLALFRSNHAHKRLHGFAQRHGLTIGELFFPQPWITGR